MARKFLAALFALALAAGCAQVERKPFDRSSANAIRRVAIVQHAEPRQYVVVGASEVPAGFLFYTFGTIGGKVLSGIESARFNSQARSLTAALQPFDPEASRLLADELERLFVARGLVVKRIEGRVMANREKPADYSSVAADMDAVVDAGVTTAGYEKSGRAFWPMVGVRVRMTGANGAPVYYSELFVSGLDSAGKAVRIEPGSRYSVPNLRALYDSGSVASQGIQEGIRSIARQIAGDLTQAP